MELQKTLTPGEALERVLRSYQTYYNIKTEAVEPPFAAEAIFGSHNEQYFLIKKAKVADIDTNETVYFATEESLSKERLLELDAIASVVIGGTLLSGGVGTVLGTLFGVAIQGLIQTYINFDGTLSSWWTKIAIGILLFIFIALQRGLTVLWENRQSSPVTRVNIAQR